MSLGGLLTGILGLEPRWAQVSSTSPGPPGRPGGKSATYLVSLAPVTGWPTGAVLARSARPHLQLSWGETQSPAMHAGRGKRRQEVQLIPGENRKSKVSVAATCADL